MRMGTDITIIKGAEVAVGRRRMLVAVCVSVLTIANIMSQESRE